MDDDIVDLTMDDDDEVVEIPQLPPLPEYEYDFNFYPLPTNVIRNIFTYLSFDEVSNVRLVCRKANVEAMSVLNAGFHNLGEMLEHQRTRVKRALPKRESLRKCHPLSSLYDAYATIESRYTLLSVTYKRHIDNKRCCFIPGKVLDEFYLVMSNIRNHKVTVSRIDGSLNIAELMREAKDLSSSLMSAYKVPTPVFTENYSMAIEHFEEVVLVDLPKVDYYSGYMNNMSNYPQYNTNTFSTLIPSSLMGTSCYAVVPMVEPAHEKDLHNRVYELEKLTQRQAQQINTMADFCVMIGTQLNLKFVPAPSINNALEGEDVKPLKRALKRSAASSSSTPTSLFGGPRRSKRLMDRHSTNSNLQSTIDAANKILNQCD